MAIKLIESPEPLTGASRQQTAVLIESDGLHMLRQELRRYCDQKVSGRSFLIAGHRGSGKTTIVQGSIQRTEEDIKLEWASMRLSRGRFPLDRGSEGGTCTTLRPLYILLQGPNLLPTDLSESSAPTSGTPSANKATTASAVPGSEPAAAPATSTASATKPEPPPSDPPPNPMETVLVQITLGLYRALAGEFTRAYSDKAVSDARAAWLEGKRAERLSRRQLELSLQFELELDQYPSVGKLHEYWRLINSLKDGILFWKEGDPGIDPGQGYRELVALASCCQAYQRICGKLSREDKNSQGDTTKVDQQVALDAKGSELIKPMMALLTGGAVGAGLLAANPGGTSLAVLGGVLTALLASFVVKYTSSRTREQAMNRADLFIPDLSVATLDRVLPVLLSRIRRAGLAPVFVVDELDKVDLTARITEMVKRLKKLVAENAFFCFLTDRRYFEEMLSRTVDAPYPIEYTYFTNKLFIVFRHRDLHEYLDRVLEIPAATSPSVLPSAPGSVAAPVASTSADDRADKEALRYILLHDSQMHPIDLRSQLGLLRSADGEVNIPRGEVRAPRRHYPFAITIQVSIELLLDQEEMRAKIEKLSGFLQLAHDTLYYISRKWSETETPLDLSDVTGRKCFEEYLLSRKATNTSLGPDADEGEVKKETEQDRLDKRYLKVDTSICTFLFKNLRQLARYLANPAKLVEAIGNDPALPLVVFEALSRKPLLIPIEGDPTRYRWTHNTTGWPVDAETGRAKKPSTNTTNKTEWNSYVATISEFEHQIKELTDRQVDLAALASQYGVLRTSPPWADAQRAIGRLQAHEGIDASYLEQDDDLQCMRDFYQVLVDGGPTVGIALACALAIGNHAPVPVFWPLTVIAESLRFRRLPPQGTLEELLRLGKAFAPPDGALDFPALSDKASVRVWSAWVRAASKQLFEGLTPDFLTFENEAWRYWEKCLREQVIRPDLPELGTIMCHGLSRGPGVCLSFPLEDMFTERWTWAFVLSLTQAHAQAQKGMFAIGISTPSSIPAWMAIAALQHLGFDQSTLDRFLEHQRAADPKLFQGEFLAYGVSSDSRAPTGLLICRGFAPSMSWKPSTSQPLLVCDVATATELVRVCDFRSKVLREALGFSFVALDLSRNPYVPLPEDPPEIVETFPNSPAPKALFLSPELAIYDFFAPDPKAPIPVLIDDPARYPGLDPLYTATGINDPAALFASISAMRRLSDKGNAS